MKNVSRTIFVFLFVFVISNYAIPGDGFDIKLNKNDREPVNFNEGKLKRDYEREKNLYDAKTNQQSLFQFYVDLQLGYGFTNANIDQRSGTSRSYNTDSKGGINAGALFFARIADIWSFSTGLDFINKSFEVDTSSTATSGTQEVSNQYVNIPININFGGMITDKIGITFNGGPYIGLLLSTDENAGLGYKNFDLGLNGTLTGSYLVAPLVSVLLGTKFQYGGLNNLGSTDRVESITTTNYTIFSGVRLGWQ